VAGQRTTVAEVLAILGGQYGSVNGITVALQPFLRRANATINQLVQFALLKSVYLQPCEEDLAIMETWTAAYYYTHNDKQQGNQSTAGASANFVTEKLDPNTFKAGAIQADPTGLLNAILNRYFANTYSLGPSQQNRVIAYPSSQGSDTCGS
jgi:hypothetical protein